MAGRSAGADLATTLFPGRSSASERGKKDYRSARLPWHRSAIYQHTCGRSTCSICTFCRLANCCGAHTSLNGGLIAFRFASGHIHRWRACVGRMRSLLGAAGEAAQRGGRSAPFSLCHRLRLLSLRWTSRTILSIWNGRKMVGSFSSFARHSIKTLSDLC